MKKLLQNLILLSCFILSAVHMYAQTAATDITVSGMVTSSEDGMPQTGVVVVGKSTQNALELMNAQGATEGFTVPSYRLLFPIPQREIDVSNGLTSQNSGY
jgi:hypothetical protein